MAVIRGAICANNTIEDISSKSVELVNSIIQENNVDLQHISAIIFSATKDLDACYPAKAVREQLCLSNVAFMCFQEMGVVGSLDHCIRVGIFVDDFSQSNVKHVYIGRAQDLRKDLK
ncbi:MAG: chorismate mutase [Clostridia bacterium]|nr:chorismate mutase [Clostridia bacterium]MBQ9707180.1 chorismate mutase [Clostridia bacterium]